MEISMAEYEQLQHMKTLAEKLIIENYKLQNVPTRSTKYSDYFKDWLNNQKDRLQINTFYIYKCNSRKIIAYFKEKNIYLETVTSNDIEEFYKYLREQGLSSNTIRRHHANIYTSLEKAVKNNMISKNPANYVQLPPKEKYNANYMQPKQLNNLLKVFKYTDIFTPVFICALMGLRRSEVLGLKWSSIDFENKTMTINHKVVEAHMGDGNSDLVFYDKMKNKTSNRILKIPSKLLAYLYMEQQHQLELKSINNKNYCKDYCNYVCVRKNGKLIKPSSLSIKFARIIKENNISKFRLHDLRHSCASILHSLGYSLKDISEYLGHSDVTMTGNIYTHIFKQMRDKMAKAIDDIIDI